MGVKDYHLDPFKSFKGPSEKDSDINLATFQPNTDIITTAKEMMKDSNCVCDLKEVSFPHFCTEVSFNSKSRKWRKSLRPNWNPLARRKTLKKASAVL